MAKRKPNQFSISYGWLAGIGIPILTFGGGVVVKAWNIADQIATRTDTQQLRMDMSADFKRTDEAIAKAVEASKKYTDEKSAQSLLEANSHSDQGRLANDAKFSAQYSDIAAKTNMILQMLDRIDRNQANLKK
jgi:hypothetical protein